MCLVSDSDPQTSKITIFNTITLIQFNVRTVKVRHSNTILFFFSLTSNTTKREAEVQSPQNYDVPDKMPSVSSWGEELWWITHFLTPCWCVFNYITCTNLHKWQRRFAVTWPCTAVVLSGLTWWNQGCQLYPHPPPLPCASTHVSITTGWAISRQLI